MERREIRGHLHAANGNPALRFASRGLRATTQSRRVRRRTRLAISLPFSRSTIAILALQVERELRAVAEVTGRAVSAVIERRPLRMSVTRPDGTPMSSDSRLAEILRARVRVSADGRDVWSRT